MERNVWDDYLKRLLQNGQDNLHICPDCYAAGRRKPFCKNAVYIKSLGKLVCCYLGRDDHCTCAKAKVKPKV